MPNPAPGGSDVKDVKPAFGSEAKRPLRGPARGCFPFDKSSKISSVSLTVKSS